MISRKVDFVICERRVNMIALTADMYLAKKNDIIMDNYAVFDLLGSESHELITRADLDTEELIEARDLTDLLYEVFVVINTYPAARAESRLMELLKGRDPSVCIEKKTK